AVAALGSAQLWEAPYERRIASLPYWFAWGEGIEHPDPPHSLRLLRARRERPRRCHAAEGSQQFPPADGDCHTPLPCEVRKGHDITPRWCSLHVQGAGCWCFHLCLVSLRQTFGLRPRLNRPT